MQRRQFAPVHVRAVPHWMRAGSAQRTAQRASHNFPDLTRWLINWHNLK